MLTNRTMQYLHILHSLHRTNPIIVIKSFFWFWCCLSLYILYFKCGFLKSNQSQFCFILIYMASALQKRQVNKDKMYFITDVLDNVQHTLKTDRLKTYSTPSKSMDTSIHISGIWKGHLTCTQHGHCACVWSGDEVYLPEQVKCNVVLGIHRWKSTERNICRQEQIKTSNMDQEPTSTSWVKLLLLSFSNRWKAVGGAS